MTYRADGVDSGGHDGSLPPWAALLILCLCWAFAAIAFYALPAAAVLCAANQPLAVQLPFLIGCEIVSFCIGTGALLFCLSSIMYASDGVRSRDPSSQPLLSSMSHSESFMARLAAFSWPWARTRSAVRFRFCSRRLQRGCSPQRRKCCALRCVSSSSPPPERLPESHRHFQRAAALAAEAVRLSCSRASLRPSASAPSTSSSACASIQSLRLDCSPMPLAYRRCALHFSLPSLSLLNRALYALFAYVRTNLSGALWRLLGRIRSRHRTACRGVRLRGCPSQLHRRHAQRWQASDSTHAKRDHARRRRVPRLACAHALAVACGCGEGGVDARATTFGPCLK